MAHRGIGNLQILIIILFALEVQVQWLSLAKVKCIIWLISQMKWVLSYTIGLMSWRIHACACACTRNEYAFKSLKQKNQCEKLLLRFQVPRSPFSALNLVRYAMHNFFNSKIEFLSIFSRTITNCTLKYWNAQNC